jgi:hypothetical protein
LSAAPDDDGFYWNRRVESSGDTALDVSCRGILGRLVETFGVHPGFVFYDDADGKNALADPVARLPDGPDGTVMMGIGLLKEEARRVATRTADPRPTHIAIHMILAHEFAHIVQFKTGWGTDIPWRWELEPYADYLAGWFLRSTSIPDPLVGDRPDVHRASDFEVALRSIFEKGDSQFTSPEHHGQEEFRAAMVRTGYYDALNFELWRALLRGAAITGCQ